MTHFEVLIPSIQNRNRRFNFRFTIYDFRLYPQTSPAKRRIVNHKLKINERFIL